MENYENSATNQNNLAERTCSFSIGSDEYKEPCLKKNGKQLREEEFRQILNILKAELNYEDSNNYNTITFNMNSEMYLHHDLEMVSTKGVLISLSTDSSTTFNVYKIQLELSKDPKLNYEENNDENRSNVQEKKGRKRKEIDDEKFKKEENPE
eukprot:gene8876-825_t